MSASPEDLRRYRKFLQEEVDGLFVYRTLAEIEQDANVRDVYQRLHTAEERHLALWQEELRAGGGDPTIGAPSRRIRILMWIARRFGAAVVLPVIKTFEAGAETMYRGDAVAERAGLPEDEASHARIFEALSSSSAGAQGSVIGRLETRHRQLGGGNALRAAVLGANDGLVSNFALIMGVAGADPGRPTVLLVGVAGLIAGAFSMALGEWISVTSSREAAEAQLAIEAEEIALMPDAEREELSLIYRAKGLSESEADALAASIMRDPDTALATLAREELGVVPENLGSPWAAAIASFILFAGGAMLPLIPFFFLYGVAGVVTSAALSAAGLFVVGGGITLLTGRSAIYSGTRQVLIGLTAATASFGIGALVGAAAGI